jgi:hypothetical protein
MILFLIISALLIIAIATFLNSPKFGKSPSGERLKRIQQSPNYKNGHFENVHSTPMMTAKGGMFTVLKQFLFDKKPGLIPSGVIPSCKNRPVAFRSPGRCFSMVWPFLLLFANR